MSLDVHTNLFRTGPVSRPALFREIYKVLIKNFCRILKAHFTFFKRNSSLCLHLLINSVLFFKVAALG